MTNHFLGEHFTLELFHTLRINYL